MLLSGGLAATNAVAQISFTSVSHNFGNVNAGSSATYSLKMTNGSSSAFPFALTLTGSSSFSGATNCPANVAAGASCEIAFTYAPTTTGFASATWTLAPNGETFTPSDGGTLSGNGLTAPGFSISTAGHNFGTQPVNTVSSPYTVNVINSTADAITLSINSTPAEYKNFPFHEDDCPPTLAAGSYCTLIWEFDPAQAQGYSSFFSIAGVDAVTGANVILTSGSSQVSGVTLSGSGINATGVYLASATHNFGDLAVGSTSVIYGTQLVNGTNQTLALSYGGSSSSFPQTGDNCGSTLAAGASCQLQWDFNPQAPGPAQLQYSIAASELGSPVAIYSNGSVVSGVTLTGTGLTGGLSLRTAGHNFGPWVVGTTSGKYTTTLSNTSNIAVDLSFSYSVASDDNYFSLTGTTCGATLLAGSSCQLQWDFSPTVTGGVGAVYQIAATDPSNDNPVTVTSGSSPVSGVTLSGNGQATAGVALASASHIFGEQGVGGQSATYGTVLYNTSGAPITLTYGYSNAAEAKNFTLVGDNCGATLGNNQSCNIQWQFTPVTTGAIDVTYDITAQQGGSGITITSGGNPVNGVELTGNGVE
jgi:hypothetical protein